MPGQLSSRLQFSAVIGVLVLGAALVFMAYRLASSNSTPEVVLPLLVVGGVLALLLVLSLVSVLFQTLGLADSKQALALPEGSVRAVIALSLVVLFAILSIFLYGSLSTSGKIQSLPDLTTEKKDEFVKNVPTAQVVLVQPTGTTFTVFYREPHNPAGEDFAKQLLVMLGTLVTAVASFYFGANTVASAQKAAKDGLEGPAPTIRRINPNTLPPGGSSGSLTVTGDNLNPITHVRLERDGSAPINVDAVQSNAHSVTGKITIPADDKTLGKWNVVVSDDAGKIRADLKDGFEVKKP